MKAAEQEHSSAQVTIGELYCCGEGVLKDKKKAAYWIKRAFNNSAISDLDRKDANRVWEEFKLWNY